MAATARVLIIAGSDSGGGAGIQADIKTVAMLGGHPMTAVTAITAQNTLGVTAVHPVPAEVVLAQIDAVVGDIGVDAVKIGMIGSAFTAMQVAERLEQLKSEQPELPIVFDPVMVATSGSSLADDATIAAFGRLMDVATIATPNLPELNRLTSEDDPVAAALHLVGRHGCAILIKGGHEEGDALADALIEEDNMTSWQGQRIDTTSTHGTGCTLASAIAFFLAEGSTLGRCRGAGARVRASRASRRAGAGAGVGADRAERGAARRRRRAAAQPGDRHRHEVRTVGRILFPARPQADRRQPGHRIRALRDGGRRDLVGPDRPGGKDPRDDRDLPRVRRSRRARGAACPRRNRVRAWPAQPAVAVARGAPARSRRQHHLSLQGG